MDAGAALKNIKDKVAKARLEEALDLLDEFCQHLADRELTKQVILLKSRYYDEMRRQTGGLTEEQNIKNRITNAVIELAYDAEEFFKEKGLRENPQKASAQASKEDREFAVLLGREKQLALLAAKRDFLKEFSKAVWKLVLEILKVAYDRTNGKEDKYLASFEKYDYHSWDLLSEVKGLIGGAVWFTNAETQEKLNRFYSWLLKLDVKLSTMVNSKQDLSTQYQQIFNEAYTEPDRLFMELKTIFGFDEKEG